MLRIFARLVADTLIVGATLFVTAGTLAWPRAWILLGVLMVVRSVSAVVVYRVNPALLRERASVLVHRGQPLTDKILLLVYMGAAFVGVPAVAAIDVFRRHYSPAPPLVLAVLGLALFALGWIIIAMALRANAFAVTVVRLQSERKHAVIDSGVYAVIRHPIYAGNPLVNVGLALWLGSYVAMLFAVVPLALLVVRIGIEERFLRRELPGYGDYALRVPYRLVPGIW
jgi:protein-S-isoprenylcysteine O-methyltransferase Ste14